MKAMVLAPTFRHREQWQVPIMDGFASNSNLTAPQQQLPLIMAYSFILAGIKKNIT
ncbi:protein of unknown function [Nitratireductor aquimarinus]